MSLKCIYVIGVRGLDMAPDLFYFPEGKHLFIIVFFLFCFFFRILLAVLLFYVISSVCKKLLAPGKGREI